MNLKEAGIIEGISEVIVTTRSASMKPNAAPIGIINKGGMYFIKLYEGSKTLSNLKEIKMLAANVVDNPIIFVKTALGDLKEDYFSLFHGFPVLKEAKSQILFKSKFIKGSSLKIFQLEPLAVQINVKEVKAVNRGLNAVIEAVIHATRYAITEEEDKEEKEKLKKIIAYYNAIVSKCGGDREKEAIQLLYKTINFYT